MTGCLDPRQIERVDLDVGIVVGDKPGRLAVEGTDLEHGAALPELAKGRSEKTIVLRTTCPARHSAANQHALDPSDIGDFDRSDARCAEALHAIEMSLTSCSLNARGS